MKLCFNLLMMLVYLYLVLLTGIWYKMTDHYTPLAWACEGFEWHAEIL